MRHLIAIAVFLISAVQAMAAVDIQQVTSPGGIKAWLVQEPTIPFVALEINFEGGAATEPADKRGVTNLMAGLLEEGTGDMDARAFAKARDSLAASFRFDAGQDYVTVSARFLTETSDQAIDLLRQAIVAPNFDEVAVARVRDQVLTSLRSDLTDPDTIASTALSAKIYGDHPYASPYEGSIDSVTALTRDDIIAAHKSTMTRDRVYVGAVGDISAEELGVMLDKLLLGLPETGAEVPPPATMEFDGSQQVIPFDTPQSVALFAQPAINRDDPDYFAAYILNHILGGAGFESRLMTEVREKRGLTYGISSFMISRDLADVWIGQVASANDRMAETVQVVKDEWARMARDGVTAEELEQAKTYLTGAYPLRFDSNAAIARILVGMQSIGRTPEYIETRNDNINAVTLEQINALAARLMDVNKLDFVIVGQPAGL
jgi:zinc protease